jgi:hypothetical protein
MSNLNVAWEIGGRTEQWHHRRVLNPNEGTNHHIYIEIEQGYHIRVFIRTSSLSIDEIGIAILENEVLAGLARLGHQIHLQQKQ